MIRTITIVVLALLGIFIHPFAPGTIDFIYRFLIFSALTYLVYLNFRTSEAESVAQLPLQSYEPAVPKTDLNVEIQANFPFLKLFKKDVRAEEFVQSQFEIIRNILVVQNGWVFYKSSADTISTLLSSAETAKESHEREYKISGLMQILDSDDKILIENNLTNDAQLLSYYSGDDYKPSSFIGIPIPLYADEKIYFTFDSANTDHFNQDDKMIVDSIRKSTSLFLTNRIKGYTLLSSLKAKDSLLDFAISLNGSKTITHAMGRLSEHISAMFEATRMTICLRKGDSDTGIVKRVVGQKDDIDEGFEFLLDQGLTGWVMAKNKPYLIEDLEKGEYFIPRYTKDEKSNFGLRSYLGIPLYANEKVFGALTLEHIITNKYSEADKKRITEIAEIFSTTFQRQQT